MKVGMRSVNISIELLFKGTLCMSLELQALPAYMRVHFTAKMLQIG
jgi:hypothetical protein